MRPTTQSTDYTTAACGLMCVINHLKPEFALSLENELEIWRSSVNLPTRASSIFGLAAFAKEQGLSPKVVVESFGYEYPDYRFKRYKKTDIELAKLMSEQHRAHAQALEIPVEERPIAFDEVTELVKMGKLLLIRLNEGVLRKSGSVSKYVLLYGYTAGGYRIVDPIQKPAGISVKEETLKEAFETLTTKKKRDHRMIIF